MAISELINLIELIRSLVSRKPQLDKEYFENFVKPIWDSFVKVHEDYMKSMKEYHDLLSDENTKIIVILNQIENDSLFTTNLRGQLYSLIEHIALPMLENQRSHLSDFTNDVLCYLTYRNLFESTNKDESSTREAFTKGFPFMGLQYVRIPIVVYLSCKGDETNRDNAKYVLQHIVRELQFIYINVTNSYQRLRKQLFQ